MKIILVKPFTQPYTTEIKGDLESMQAIVGGYIEAVYPFDDQEIALVCNEEGKLEGLTPNRFLLIVTTEYVISSAGTSSSVPRPPTARTSRAYPTT